MVSIFHIRILKIFQIAACNQAKRRLGYFNIQAMAGIYNDDIELIVSSGKSVTFDKSADKISIELDECDEEDATSLSVQTVKFLHV